MAWKSVTMQLFGVGLSIVITGANIKTKCKVYNGVRMYTRLKDKKLIWLNNGEGFPPCEAEFNFNFELPLDLPSSYQFDEPFPNKSSLIALKGAILYSIEAEINLVDPTILEKQIHNSLQFKNNKYLDQKRPTLRIRLPFDVVQPLASSIMYEPTVPLEEGRVSLITL